MEVNDLAEPLTSFLSAAQAARLTPAAAELTKEGMLAAMHSYAAGGTLVGSLEKGDILSVRDAFAERQSAVGVTAGGGGSCCCCCAASDTPLGISVGALRLGSVSDVSRAVAMTSVDSDGQGGGSCCCCCI